MRDTKPIRDDNSFLPARVWRDERGAVAVEFSLIAGLFLALLFAILQCAFVWIGQNNLDTATLALGEQLTYGTLPFTSSADVYRTKLCAGLQSVACDADLALAVDDIANLNASSAPVVDGTVNVGAPGSVIVIRSEAPAPRFIPGWTPMLRSFAVVRRP